MSLPTLLQRIHTSTGNFADLKSEISSYNLDPDIPAQYHFLKSHLLRELNKRARIYSPSEMIEPYDAGLRPINPEYAMSGLILIDGDQMLLIDGGRMVQIY